jgi:hypothetical protein
MAILATVLARLVLPEWGPATDRGGRHDGQGRVRVRALVERMSLLNPCPRLCGTGPDGARGTGARKGKTVDLRRALTFTFADPRWPATLGLATVLNLPSVLLLAVALIGGRPTLAWMPGRALGADLLWSAATGLVSVPFSGYLLRIARGALSGQDAPLPGWSDVGGLLRDGLALGVLILLWFLPVDLAREAAGREPGASDDVLRLAFQALEGAFTLVVPVVLPAAEGAWRPPARCRRRWTRGPRWPRCGATPGGTR